MMQRSTGEFHKHPDEYLHYSRQTFQTGLEMDLLQEYLLVPLDIFLKNQHTVIEKLDAWLYLIASDEMEDIKRGCTAYPEFKEIYRDIFQFRYHQKELVSMFSEALRILDQDTVQYMIDDMQRQIEEQRAELASKDIEIVRLKKMEQEYMRLRGQIEEMKGKE